MAFSKVPFYAELHAHEYEGNGLMPSMRLSRNR